ncbi:flavonol 7-O-beta-glucosyltransferase UGT74F1-like [Arachis stenosperma]|uniref:flavonol 7-O-beta-glucosyltransferase UGT74F1-like n=1 Tax=Arachis stenosperma TaxID=217475 RepID=UPI0025AD417F|nr:flavonol 7-O-beta-glucosyltransferase UGT74F1-like [Arachis stenosperma]
MEEERRNGKVMSQKHILMIPYPSQGHLNPMLQFSKRLSTKGVTSTLVITKFISKSMHLHQLSSLPSSIKFDTISDGYDQGGFSHAESISSYVSTMKTIGSKSLKELIKKYNESSRHPIDCIVYDGLLAWVLDVAKEFGIIGVTFFTHMCAVDYTFYCVHNEILKVPVTEVPINIEGLPLLELKDTPSFVCNPAFYPAYFDMVMNQFSNVDKADLLLVNSFYKLEHQVVDSMSKLCPMLTIGPTVPYSYLDKAILNDTENNLNLFQLELIHSNWLNQKAPRSVIYVSFGSMVSFTSEQMEELAFGLIATGFNFLWVITYLEREKLKKEIFDEIHKDGKGLIVNWIPQLGVLSSNAIGCFLTHCGWNSTIEALCLGVPMVAMPQWTDQPMNAKFVEDVWKVGVRVKVDGDNGVVRREEIERCIRKVMGNDVGKELRKNAEKWRELAVEAVSEGGTSDNNINEFMNLIEMRS